MKKLKGFFLNIILIWFIFAIYKKLPYYQNFLKQETYTILLYLAISYTIIGLIYYSLSKKTTLTKGELIFSLIYKILKIEPKKITKQEKTASLFILVKIFFLPIMLNFLIGNFHVFKIRFSQITINSIITIEGFNNLFFPLALITIFFLDTLWFSFGYAFESSFLKNTIRSVEPTIFGWVITLVCYPPFNSFLTKYISWYAYDYQVFSNPITTTIVRGIIILLLSIYVGATFALGTKCSNLTNRGIVSRGPYAIVRHPAYISKNLAWWLTIIPIVSIPAILSMSAWSLIYHLRAITEEKHLSQDPDYQKYKKKVKWRYIPKIY